LSPGVQGQPGQCSKSLSFKKKKKEDQEGNHILSKSTAYGKVIAIPTTAGINK
jgi:hypothetical protein